MTFAYAVDIVGSPNDDAGSVWDVAMHRSVRTNKYPRSIVSKPTYSFTGRTTAQFQAIINRFSGLQVALLPYGFSAPYWSHAQHNQLSDTQILAVDAEVDAAAADMQNL